MRGPTNGWSMNVVIRFTIVLNALEIGLVVAFNNISRIYLQMTNLPNIICIVFVRYRIYKDITIKFL